MIHKVSLIKNYLQLQKSVGIIISLGLCVRILYLSYTPYSERTHDVLNYGGHLDYIKYVANNLGLHKICSQSFATPRAKGRLGIFPTSSLLHHGCCDL